MQILVKDAHYFVGSLWDTACYESLILSEIFSFLSFVVFCFFMNYHFGFMLDVAGLLSHQFTEYFPKSHQVILWQM